MNDASAHLSEDRIQEWLDGRFPVEEATRIQAHLDRCERCRVRAESWRALAFTLSALPALAPGDGFRGAVLDAVRRAAPERRSLAARVRGRISAWWGESAKEHPAPERLQDLLEGALPGRRAKKVRLHLAVCADCRREAQTWRTLLHGLSTLPRTAPSPGFATRVMARVRVPEAVPARKALARRLRDRLRASAGPGRRRAWAAVAGVALTPLVTFAAVAWAVFSLPLVTVGNLATFLWLEASALTATLGGAVGQQLRESAALFRAWSVVDLVTRSPATTGAGLLAFSALTLLALWVLYRNLFAAPAAMAHAQAS